jgi:hypothetical protein
MNKNISFSPQMTPISSLSHPVDFVERYDSVTNISMDPERPRRVHEEISCFGNSPWAFMNVWVISARLRTFLRRVGIYTVVHQISGRYEIVGPKKI